MFHSVLQGGKAILIQLLNSSSYLTAFCKNTLFFSLFFLMAFVPKDSFSHLLGKGYWLLWFSLGV